MTNIIGASWCFVIDVGRDPETQKRRQRWQSGFATRKAAEEGLFNAAVKWTLVSSNPVRATSTPTIRAPKLTTPTATELRSLADSAVGTTWDFPILLATTTGARRAEVLGLRWSRVDLERGRVRIDETLQRADGELSFVPPKTEKARREIPLPAFAVERVRVYKADQARRRCRPSTRGARGSVRPVVESTGVG